MATREQILSSHVLHIGDFGFFVVERDLNGNWIKVLSDTSKKQINCSFDAIGMDMSVQNFGMTWRTKAHYNEIIIQS